VPFAILLAVIEKSNILFPFNEFIVIVFSYPFTAICKLFICVAWLKSTLSLLFNCCCNKASFAELLVIFDCKSCIDVYIFAPLID